MSPLLVQEVEDEPATAQTLELTPVEATLRRLLLDVARYIDGSPIPQSHEGQADLPDGLAGQDLVLRFTGGWVRDKLLGVGSHDIDVSINKMTGIQFGLRLKEYLEIPGNPEKYGLEGVATNDKQSQKAGTTDKSKTVGGLHKIEANPEKSKHLETVTTRILGLDIDLVNLRKETYSVESRTPQMEFGTPEEDALRRDATINAMFYNINTEQVEDFTKRGREDLRSKFIRTPLEPYQTFKDDPLRILRLIRFASKLDYKIDPTAQSAMQNHEIQEALRQKISRERVGVELEKALRGPDPHEALRLIFELDLYETIFSDPTVATADHYRADTKGWQSVIGLLQDTVQSDSAISTILLHDSEERFLAWQLAALFPYRDAPQPEPSEPGRRAPPPIAAQIAKEGIKCTNKVSDVIIAAVRNQSEVSRLVDKFHMQQRRPDKQVDGEDASARDVLGMAIRRWGLSWRSQAMYAMLVDIANDTEAANTIERRYIAFVEHLRDLDILDACSFKPLMDGKTLAKALNTSPGPWMKDALDVVMAFQLRHPNSANFEDAIAEVNGDKQRKATQNGGELTSSLVQHFLELTIRPLFVKAKPTSVTDTGRKNTQTVLPKKATVESVDDRTSKPWKDDNNAYALDLLEWCVQTLDEELLEEVWSLVVPPCLTLLDDWEVKFKEIGAGLMETMLIVTPVDLLERTGLGEVFEEALMPCLTFLPTITPEAESIPLLDSVYPALLALAEVRYPYTPSRNSKSSRDELNHQLIKFLDTIVRKGIIYGYTHCSNYPRIVATLFKHSVLLVNELGVESVKHLKYLMPMLTETLSHPLAEAQTDTLLAATKALQALIRNAWPRMVEYHGEVLKGLTLCWLQTANGADEAAATLRTEIKEAIKMLRAAVGENVDLDGKCKLLVRTEPRLSGLFAI